LYLFIDKEVKRLKYKVIGLTGMLLEIIGVLYVGGFLISSSYQFEGIGWIFLNPIATKGVLAIAIIGFVMYFYSEFAAYKAKKLKINS